VGSEQVDAVVDVRFISATNRDPQDAVEEGALRSDLFYRLRVVPITLPPLRKRQEDIPLLANHFLTYYWHRHRQMGERVPRLSDGSIAFLRSRAWRGNVRELQNVIEHVAVLAEPDQVIQPNDIPIYDDATTDWPAEAAPPAGVMDEAYHVAKDRVVAQFEREYLGRLVSRAGGNMSKAARLASIDRTTLYRLMDKHEFHRDESPGTPE
jgi:DNA-binding NtrC family response regulator